MRLGIIAALALLPASAQVARYEVFGSAGWSRPADSTGTLGTGAAASGGFVFRPVARLGLRFEAAAFRHDWGETPTVSTDHRSLPWLRLTDRVAATGSAVCLCGDVVYYPSRGKVQPYLLAGLGMLRSSRMVYWYAGSGFGVFGGRVQYYYFDDIHENALGYRAGGGVKFFLGPSLSIGPEVKFVGASSGLRTALISVATAYHF